MMNDNSKAIIVFCSHLCLNKDVQPLQPSEWGALAAKMLTLGIEPRNLLSFNSQDFSNILGLTPMDAQRMIRLIDRSVSLAFEVTEYESRGIRIITRADEEYPLKLKNNLHQNCPPLFYCSGDLSILKRKSIGYVGSRKITPADADFTIKTATNRTSSR